MALPNFSRTKAGVKNVPKGHVIKYKDKQGYYTGPKVTVKKKPVPGTASGDDIVKIARARAQATLAAAGKPIRQQGERQATQQINAAAGLASVLEPLSKRIQEIYGGASQATADLGRGYSDQVRGAIEAADAATQARLAEFGLPSPGAAPAAAVGDVVYGLGGSMPASNLTQQGAGFASAAAFLPATARLQGQAEAATIRQKMLEAIAELQGKGPSLFSDELTNERNWRNTQFDNYTNYLNASQAGYGGSAKPKITIRPDGTIVSIDPYTGVPTVTGQTTPSSTTPTTGPGSAAGKAKASAIKARNDATIKVVAKQTDWLNAAILRSQKPVKVGEKKGILGGSTPIYKKPAPPTYKYAFNYIFNQLWLSLKRYGYKKADIRQMTTQILESNDMRPAAPKPPRLPLGD